MTLTPGQYAHLVVEQVAIDLAVELVAPNGKQTIDVNFMRAGAREEIFYEATEGGQYQITIRADGVATLHGSYRALLQVEATATAQDRKRIAAQQLLVEAKRLYRQAPAGEMLAKYKAALVLWREIGERYWEAYTINNLGIAYDLLSLYDDALAAYQQALAIKREMADRTGEGRTLTNIGFTYRELGRYEQAIEYLEQALSLTREVGDKEGEEHALIHLGGAYYSLGRYDKAIEYRKQALSIAREIHNRADEAGTLLSLGAAYIQLSAYEKAIEHCEQSLTISRELKNRYIEGLALNSLGTISYYLDEFDRSVDYYQQALTLKRSLGDREGEAGTLGNLGNTYTALGDYEKAIACQEQALRIRREIKDRDGEGTSLRNLGEINDSLNRDEKAIEYFNQALAIKQEVKNRDDEGHALSSLGALYLKQHRYDQAIAYLEQALAISREVRNRRNEVETLYLFAKAESGRGNSDRARVQIDEGLKIIESLRSNIYNPELRTAYFASVQKLNEYYISLLMLLHQAHPAQGFDALALQAAERARARSLLELLAEARADIHQGANTALLANERNLQQQLNAKVAAQTSLLSGKGDDARLAALVKEIGGLTTRLEEVEKQIRVSSPHYAALTQPQPLSAKEIQEQVLDKDTILLEYALGQDRSYLWAVTPNQVLSYELPPRVRIEQAARHVYELLTARQSRPNLSDAERRLRVVEADKHYLAAASDLSEMLLGPVASLLGNKRLVIVAPGALQYLPFAALPEPQSQESRVGSLESKRNSNRTQDSGLQTRDSRLRLIGLPLIVKHEIVNLPSASVLAILRRETAGRQPAANAVAVLADPVFSPDDPRVKTIGKRSQSLPPGPGIARDGARVSASKSSNLERSVRDVAGAEGRLSRLPFTREEAEAIWSVTPHHAGLKALDFQANRATATSDELSHYRIIHFATHALFDSTRPELSGLVLSLVDEAGRPQDGFLSLHEIYGLRLRADIVVLSACQTALGKDIKGEGLIGPVRGFMYAGAPRVIASLWQVDDLATAELMKHFYKSMLQDNQRPAAALRTAQVELRKQKRWQSPYFWAAFVLQGEWK